ncbi:putative tripartite motif-containing protein 75 [Apteryx rowi]|uniref:putative tripartite motif-containing protein 75 n=1 Tax=Apteryx rowi TaxID=308060 RepID=UPI000E1C83DA|nr:putative tripartite motif-containing protein 75 [Apteryx rowi]
MAMGKDAVGTLQDKVTCSICLEILRDVVTINCGHSFCHECITYTELMLQAKPRVISIFLDHEAREATFYNRSNRSHIHTFRDVPFSEALRQNFYPRVLVG